MLEFSVDMAREMDDQLKVKKSFRRLVSSLALASEIVPVIEELDFTGGVTYHRDVIRL